MQKNQVTFKFNKPHARITVGASGLTKAHVFHCNYYNNYLQRTIWKDAETYVDSERLLIGAAVEQAYNELKVLFHEQEIQRVDDRKAFAEAFYAWQGFGLLNFGPITESGGVTMSESQHYAEGWFEQFGRSSEPVGLMTRGWLAGAAAAIFDMPQAYFATDSK